MGRSFQIVALWIIAATIIAAVILVCLPKSTHVRLELVAEGISFTAQSQEGEEREVCLANSLCGNSFDLLEFAPVMLQDVQVSEIIDSVEKSLTAEGITIEPTDPEFSTLTLEGEDLILTNLRVRSGARIEMVIDKEGMVTVTMDPSPEDTVAASAVGGIQCEISMAESLTATVYGCRVVDENERVLIDEYSQRNLLIDPGLGGIIYYRSDSVTSVSVNLGDEFQTPDAKALRIYDPAENSWTVKHSSSPISVPGPMTAVVDGKIYLIEGVLSSIGRRGIKLLNGDLSISGVEFIRESDEESYRETARIKKGSIVFLGGELNQIDLTSEFLKFKEDDEFQLVETTFEGRQLRFLLTGRPKSILTGLQEEVLNQRLPTTLEWFYTNQKVATTVAVVLCVIALIVKLGPFFSPSKKGKRTEVSRRKRSVRFVRWTGHRHR